MPPVRKVRGFTLVELVTVMILIGILAVVALPRLDAASEFGATSFRDRVAASLRFAQKSAVAKRRMVCATVAADGLSLSLAVASSFGAGACDTAMNGPDGSNPAATSPGNATLTPAGTLFFQPSGAVSSNAAGTAIADQALAVTGQTAITITGATGHVE